MPKKVPSQFTGRFSIKPKKSSSKSKNVASTSSSQEPESAPLSAPEPVSLPENLRDEPIPFQKRKRKLSGESGAEEGTSIQTRDPGESLDVYSQQLEVQPPPKRCRYHMTEQSETQVEQAGILGEPNQSVDQQARIRLPSTLPNPKEPHQYQDEAIAILKTGWQCADDAQPDIEATAQALANRASNVPDADTLLFVRYIVRAMQCYASEHAQAIDFMLLAFSEAIKLLPDSFLDKHGNGPDATITQLKWLLIDQVNGFDGFLLPNSPATFDLEDRSNLKFQCSQLSSNLPGVLSQIHDWRFQRKMWFISAAAQSRCFALEILRKKNGEHIESLIDAGLNRRSSQWSKVNMLGACILLRGCAKSLNAGVPTSGIKVYAWKASLDKFLLQDDETWDNDFVIKAHAAVESPPSHPCTLGHWPNTV